MTEFEKMLAADIEADRKTKEAFDIADEAEARRRCDACGMDPDFVGVKGYPNWKDFTAERRRQIQEFVNWQTEEFGINPIILD